MPTEEDKHYVKWVVEEDTYFGDKTVKEVVQILKPYYPGLWESVCTD